MKEARAAARERNEEEKGFGSFVCSNSSFFLALVLFYFVSRFLALTHSLTCFLSRALSLSLSLTLWLSFISVVSFSLSLSLSLYHYLLLQVYP